MQFLPVDFFHQIIIDEINPTIDIHKASNENSFYFEFKEDASDSELQDFIRSIPYYSHKLKEFLESTTCRGIVVDEIWVTDFIEHTRKWAESDEWLYYDVEFICNQSTIENNNILFLDLPKYHIVNGKLFQAVATNAFLVPQVKAAPTTAVIPEI